MFGRRAPTFEQVYRDHGDRIYRFCYRLCGNPTDAEDLAQETLLLAFRGLDRFEGRSSLTTWLYRIALNRWQRMRPAGPVTVPLEPDLDAAVHDAPLERLSLEAALERLPAPLLEAFLLVKVEGLKYREAAQVLEVPIGTLQYRVHDATVRLRRILAPEEPAAAPERRPSPFRLAARRPLQEALDEV